MSEMRHEIPIDWSTDLLCISDIGCGLTRRALLGLEPGSRLWLEIEGVPLLFEHVADGEDGRSTPFLKPIMESAELWMGLCASLPAMAMQFDFIERPADRGKSTAHALPTSST